MMGGPPPLHAGLVLGVHAGTHWPSTHPWFEGHGLPQVPQFLLSIWTSTHTPAHPERPGGHVGTQPPAVQNWLLGQVVPHAPQLFALVADTQLPLQEIS